MQTRQLKHVWAREIEREGRRYEKEREGRRYETRETLERSEGNTIQTNLSQFGAFPCLLDFEFACGVAVARHNIHISRGTTYVTLRHFSARFIFATRLIDVMQSLGCCDGPARASAGPRSPL